MQIRFEKKDTYILAIGEGERNDLATMIDSTKKIVAAAATLGESHFLADYRKVKYNIPLTEVYNLVKIFETKIPEIRDLKIAGVIDIGDIEVAKFWESVSNRRDFGFKVFTDMDEAIKWLKEVKSPSKK